MSEKTLDLTVDEWMGMYHIAADRADKAEAEVKRLQTENAQLRKVMNDVMNIALNGDAEEWLALREVLAEVERPGDTEPTEP